MHSIYEITITGKKYYGYTSRDPYLRLREHVDIARDKTTRTKFYNALRANLGAFEFKVLYSFKTELEALLKEIELIKKAKTCLNTTPGGEGKTIQVSIVNGKVVIKKRTFKKKTKWIRTSATTRRRRIRRGRR